LPFVHKNVFLRLTISIILLRFAINYIIENLSIGAQLEKPRKLYVESTNRVATP